MAGDNVHHRKAPTLFGEQPDTPWEGWEYIVYPTYIAVLLLGMVGVFYKPDTSIHNWARVEALARLRRKAKGEEVLWGVHYANIPTMTYSAESPYSKEAVGELPSKDE
ncbi:hypothetical protein M885DRAFT_570447 [Pelagophyceae sp. CCMP2097]|nr:hypothetical protein M885DRAFT_570447 [Pelagophyceae sp. CCMP2097]